MALKAKTLLNAVTATGASGEEIFDSAKNLLFAYQLSAALGAGETATVKLEYKAGSSTWIPFKTWSLDNTSATEGTQAESNARGFDVVRANVTAYNGGTKTITVTVNWRDPSPVGIDRA